MVVALVGEDGVPNVVGQREQDGVDVLEERASVVLDHSRRLLGLCGITPSAKLTAFQTSHGLLFVSPTYASHTRRPLNLTTFLTNPNDYSEVRLSVSVSWRVNLTPCSEKFNAMMARLSRGKSVTDVATICSPVSFVPRGSSRAALNPTNGALNSTTAPTCHILIGDLLPFPHETTGGSGGRQGSR